MTIWDALHTCISICSSKHVLEEVTVIRWEVAGKWFPQGLTANRGNKNGHTGNKLRVSHSWVDLPSRWNSLAYWRIIFYINMSALNTPGLMPHTQIHVPTNGVAVIIPSGSRPWFWVSPDLCLVFLWWCLFAWVKTVPGSMLTIDICE